MSASTRDWFDYVVALTPAVIAVFVAFVAYRQWQVARHKLRLDLYNKRFAVLEATLTLYQETLSATKLTEDEFEEVHRRFITAMIESRFLFSEESGISKLMEIFNTSVFIVKGSRSVMKHAGIPPEELSKVFNKVTDEQMKMPKKLENIERAMKPYLAFTKLSA